MTDEQPANPDDTPTTVTEAYAATDQLACVRRALNATASPVTGPKPSVVETLERLSRNAGLPSNGMTFGPLAGPIIHRTEPPVHRHRWAWAQLVSGGVRRVCYDCGTEA